MVCGWFLLGSTKDQFLGVDHLRRGQHVPPHVSGMEQLAYYLGNFGYVSCSRSTGKGMDIHVNY
jgi:hypothetical protein